MLTSYLKIAIRNIRREAIYSTINITGLTLGIISSLLIGMWVLYEWSFDTAIPNHEHIYRIHLHTKFKDRIETRNSSPATLASELEKFNDVEDVAVTRSIGSDRQVLAAGTKKLYSNGIYATPDFFRVFQVDFTNGVPTTALKDSHSIVLTETLARKLFGSGNAIGETITLDNKVGLVVTAIMRTLPENTSLSFDYVIPLSLFETEVPWAKDCITAWDCHWFRTYCTLKPGRDPEVVTAGLLPISKIHMDQHGDATEEFFLYPMSRWHLHGNFENGVETSHDKSERVSQMSWLGAIILLVACINFMNLTTARSARRAREVGIRKVVGSSRRQLMTQFMGESILLAMIAFIIAIILVQLTLPAFRLWLGVNVSLPYQMPYFWFASLALILVVGIVAGSYPALYLSSFLPINVLKNKVSSIKNAWPRKLLVIFQFGLSSLVVIVSIVIYQQVVFGRDRELGFLKDGLITIPDNAEFSQNYKIIREKLLASGAVQSMVKTNSPVTDIYEVNYLTWTENRGAPLMCTNIFTDYDYCKTLGIKLLKGRDFSPDVASDTSAVIFNKAAMDMMKFDEPLGQEVYIGPDKLHIIGIMEDVLMGNPFDPVDPLYMVHLKDWSILYNNPNVTIRVTDLSRIREVQNLISSYTPNHPFDYQFVDSQHREKFSAITLIAEITNVFAILAVVVASLGLFGLAGYTAEQRQREFSIRKVLGASITILIQLLSKDFLRLILIAFTLFSPLAYFVSQSFLQRYDYRIDFAWWIIPITGTLLLLLTIGITSTQALKAGSKNPADVLKIE